MNPGPITAKTLKRLGNTIAQLGDESAAGTLSLSRFLDAMTDIRDLLSSMIYEASGCGR